MPQLTRNWYFASRPAPDDARRPDDDDASAPGLTSAPSALLQRHGARVLDPATAPVIPRDPNSTTSPAAIPRPTVYRARTLLIPADLLSQQPTVSAINSALAPVGMRILPPDLERRQVRGGGRVGEVLRQLPRVAVLAPTAEPGKPAVPVTVDAWTALQALRAAAEAPDAREHQLTPAQVRRISLEHLLAGSAITGSPSTEGNGISGSPSTEGNGLTGPGSVDSYTYAGGDTRAPVSLSLPAPARRRLEDCGSRRPVVAVLDTGVRAHPWLDVRPDPVHRYATRMPDGFVAVDRGMQNAIEAESLAAAAQGDQPRVPIEDPWDTPVSADPLLGELNDATGHGTFIAGIVRQVAPDSQVLAIRIMHSDDIVYEGDLLCALALLADRVAVAQSGGEAAMAAMVDVVSLSLGYFDESSADVAYSSGLWQIIELLLQLGVAVVAAAGNYSTSRRFYPAAFSLRPSPGPLPVISVGALNPNGSKAIFSDAGRWVWAWAAGAAVVSTFPDDINGSRGPEIRVRPHPDNAMPPQVRLPDDREALDPDNYNGGFAVWSGTSFSAPLIAAHLAAQLLRQAGDPGLGLDLPGSAAATDRSAAAFASLAEIPLMPADDIRSAGAAAGLPDRRAYIADLVTAAKGGDDGALGQIVTELSPMLWHVARAVGLDVEDAEDVLQTVWTRLVAHLDTIHDCTALIGWLVVTTRREAWRVHAAARKQLPTDQEWLSELPDHAPGSEELIMIDDERRALWEAIGKLSRRCQELLRIVAFVPRPDYQALAAELGMPTGSIGPTRGRCLVKLRTLLASRP